MCIRDRGRIIAITSRGIPEFPQTGHGNGCIDLPSIYASPRFNEQLIRQAAQSAGHPLPTTDSSTTPQTEPTDPGPSDDVEEEGDSTSDEETVEEETPKRKKKKTIAVQSASCTSTSAPAHGSWGLGLVVFVAAASVRRSRRRA